MAISKWQQWKLQRTMERELKKLVKKNSSLIESIQSAIANLVATNEEEHQQHVVVILCAGILNGFETKQERLETLKMIEETVKNYED